MSLNTIIFKNKHRLCWVRVVKNYEFSFSVSHCNSLNGFRFSWMYVWRRMLLWKREIQQSYGFILRKINLNGCSLCAMMTSYVPCTQALAVRHRESRGMPLAECRDFSGGGPLQKMLNVADAKVAAAIAKRIDNGNSSAHNINIAVQVNWGIRSRAYIKPYTEQWLWCAVTLRKRWLSTSITNTSRLYRPEVDETSTFSKVRIASMLENHWANQIKTRYRQPKLSRKYWRLVMVHKSP